MFIAAAMAMAASTQLPPAFMILQTKEGEE
jgi:hypothetical protein